MQSTTVLATVLTRAARGPEVAAQPGVREGARVARRRKADVIAWLSGRLDWEARLEVLRGSANAEPVDEEPLRSYACRTSTRS